MDTPEINPGSVPKRGKGSIVAVIIVIIVIASGLGVLWWHYSSSSASPNIVGTITATTGQPYYTNITTKPFTSLTVYFGDGSSYTTHQSSTKVELNHTYTMPGSAFIYYNETLKGGGYYNSSSELLPVIINAATNYITSTESLGQLPYNASASSTPRVTGQMVFSPDAKISFVPSYDNEPVNASWAVVQQTITEYRNATKVGVTNVPYYWNASSATYLTSFTDKVNLITPGLYAFEISTITAQFNNITGKYSNTEQSLALRDVAVFNNGNITQAGLLQTKSVFTIAENLGSYSGLDGAIFADSVSEEILMNVYQHLVVYNGSKVQFEPQLATEIPTIANGGINNNYKNYTVTADQNGTMISYPVHLQPYENFTFHIRSNQVFANGDPVTAWDVLYSITRDLLFVADPPDTPGFIFAANFLPGDYYSSNTFFNITQNITVNNQSQTITFHFGHAMSPNLVYEILAAGGTYVMDASWLEAHGSGITWTNHGFQNYVSEGAPAGYVQYTETHVMANGPYEIAYTEPGQEVVLTKNPTYVSPGPWAPAASINTINILYVGTQANTYLFMRSGQAQSAGITSANFNEIKQLEANGQAKTYFFPTISLFWYSFNANVNLSVDSSLDPAMNMPVHFFASQNVRKAFAYAFNYPYYYSSQVDNALYNVTFASKFAGMMPVGMPGGQSISALNNTTTGVPYYNMQIAKQYWSYALNELGKMGVTKDASTGDYMYNGHVLQIPIIVDSNDPANNAGATTWAKDLAKFVTGASFPIIPLTLPAIIAYSVPYQNPMPLYYLGWEPDYPYPTDYVGSMEYPTNSSLYPGADGMVPYVMQQYGNITQANELKGMLTNYNNAISASNGTQKMNYFHEVNEMTVNLTLYVPLQQIHQFWVVNPSIKSSSITNYEENIMFGGGSIMLFYYLQYT